MQPDAETKHAQRLDRVCDLVAATIEDEANLAEACAATLGVVRLMARRLPPDQRTLIAWVMLSVVSDLEARLN